jgi:hypothetical protein
MEYVDLKEKLEKLLIEDLSNRSTLQDTRRNLFQNSEGSKFQKELISQKELEINSLTLLVEKKKSIVQLKDDEIESLKNQVKELQGKFSSLEERHQQELEDTSAKLQDTEQLNRLSIQNEEYTAKIRELIYHIDKQDKEIEGLKNELSTKAALESKLSQLPALEEKAAEYERLSKKLDLIINSERTLKLLVSSQNMELENQVSISNAFKQQSEEMAAGWQLQQEQLINDNAILQADLALVTGQYEGLKQNAGTQVEVESIVENSQLEKEHLSSELKAVKQELDIVLQQRDGKVVLLQSEISSLQAQITALQENIYQETEEKQKLSEQLAELTTIISEKETQLSTTNLVKTDDEELIGKLLSQVNLLNEQKNNFDTMYEGSETGLMEAAEALTNLTQAVENQKIAISDLEHTNKNIKLAQTLMLQVKDKTAAKQAINELVRDIESCIALLSE